MADAYIGSFTADLDNEAGTRLATLIWGDPVHVLSASGDRTAVLARGWRGWVDTAALSDQPLLEIYVIDVGQGDAVLVRTPRGRWLVIDGGRPAADQMTKKSAVNFIRWKFLRDLRLDRVSLESVVVSHHDADHFGGLIDVLDGRVWGGDRFPVEVGTLYHGGLPRFGGQPELGETVPGEVATFPTAYRGIRRTGSFHPQLLGGRDTFADPPRPFADLFGRFAELVARVPDSVERLDHVRPYLPGYGPTAQLTIRVLGPVVEEFAPGERGLRRLGRESETLNGHSIVLRLEYGDVRILLTGDLNERSMKLLRSYYPDQEFAVDVAKACHHGAEDVDFAFLAAMQPRVTVISSGDNEAYAHPRPVVMGASAKYGRESVAADGRTVVPPLVYSTELARSVKLGYAQAVRPEATGAVADPDEFEVRTEQEGDDFEPLERIPLSTDLIYGLVNVRTDGTRILCATMLESGNSFDVKVITPVDPS